MLTLGVLCSGGLGFDTLLKIHKVYEIQFILTDKKSVDIIQFSKEKNILVFAGNPRNGAGYKFIKDVSVDVITSINYLFLIEEDIFNHSNKITFNIHGSLLPKFRGRTPHVWAIIKGEKKTGITAHLINSGCDTGKIMAQIEIPIEENDTGGILLEKYAKEYFPLIENVLEKVESNQLTLTEQIEANASYFGKRTPADGEINWTWNEETIRNWIRAQAHPYPGAFTFYEGQKIIIDKISLIDYKSNPSIQVGEIVQVYLGIIVKTGKGFVKLDRIRTKNCIFKVGKKFKNEDRK
jgi:methionyl-tRNA formyltransferase